MEHLSEGVPVIRGEHILKDGSVSHDWNNYWFVSQDIADNFPRTTLHEGDLVMSVRGSVGKIGIIDQLLQDAQLSPNCINLWC
jgi:type I restriction enzyme S subunit